MRGMFSLFPVIILLLIFQAGFSLDSYAMGCKPAETPEQGVSKPVEKALTTIEKHPHQPGLSNGKRSTRRKVAPKEIRRIKSHNLRQIAAFRVKKNAKNLVKKLKGEGYEAVIHIGITKNNKQLYRVFASKSQKAKKKTIPDEARHRDSMQKLSAEQIPVIVEKVPEKQIELPKDDLSRGKTEFKPVAEKQSSEEQTVGDKRIAVKQNAVSHSISRSGDIGPEPSPVQQREEEAPVGATRKRLSGDVFGKGGFLHPFLAVTEYYTDNVFFTKDNRKSDFATIISPGIWLTVPHVYERLLHIDTSNLSPGGFSLSRYRPETFRRYQAYLFYNADIERYAKYSSENAVNHRAEGLFQYNLRGGLSVDLLDQFVASHDVRGTNITTSLDKFTSNLAGVTVSYDASYRFKFRVDYSNFLLHYVTRTNDFRNRDDNAVSGYLFYKLRPKASLFTEYEFVDIRYKTSTLPNSKEHHFFGGIEWDITAKSRGSVKAGYGLKDFQDSALGNNKDFIMEAQVDHKLTSKTSLIVKATRTTNETNVLTTDFVVSNAFGLEYLQRITGKITADAKLSFTNDNYNGNFTSGGVTKKLRNYYYNAAFALQYKFKEWLQMDLGYVFDLRDSTFEEFDYINNRIFIRLTGTL
jgi:hypothetical protein